MSVELISVLIAVLAVGATLGGLILTGNRGLRQDIRQDMARMESQLREDMGKLESRLRDDIKQLGDRVGRLERIAKPSSKDYWKDCARPSAGGPPPARLPKMGNCRIKGLTMERGIGAQNHKSQEPRAKSQEREASGPLAVPA